MSPAKPYGLLAEFVKPHQVVEAAERARQQGYHCLDAYVPYPVEGLSKALGHKKTVVPLYVLIGGVCGGVGGYFMEWWAMAIDYPLNIGGRPFNSWPAYIPITFELTILIAAIAAVTSMLALNRLPELHHPVFNAPGFERASTDRFFLCIEARDPKFEPVTTRKFLDSLTPLTVQEVFP